MKVKEKNLLIHDLKVAEDKLRYHELKFKELEEICLFLEIDIKRLKALIKTHENNPQRL